MAKLHNYAYIIEYQRLTIKRELRHGIFKKKLSTKW